jgi:putative oxidoreductase
MQKLIRLFRDCYGHGARVLGFLQSPLLFAIRLYWGWQFAQDGWRKLHHLDRVARFFGSLHLPAPHATAVFVAMIEFIGGILLAAGIATRLTALVLFINMTVAFWTAEKDAFLGVISNPDKFQAADAYTYWFAALLIMILGPGLIAIDTLVGKLPAAKAKT